MTDELLAALRTLPSDHPARARIARAIPVALAGEVLTTLGGPMNDHTRLDDAVADAIRHGLDAGRIHLPPRAERTLIAAAVEHLEEAGYTLTAADRGDAARCIWPPSDGTPRSPRDGVELVDGAGP